MPPFGPVGRQDLIQALRRLGLTGPLPGKRRQIMIRSIVRVRIPNPHQGDIGRGLKDAAPRMESLA